MLLHGHHHPLRHDHDLDRVLFLRARAHLSLVMALLSPHPWPWALLWLLPLPWARAAQPADWSLPAWIFLHALSVDRVKNHHQHGHWLWLLTKMESLLLLLLHSLFLSDVFASSPLSAHCLQLHLPCCLCRPSCPCCPYLSSSVFFPQPLGCRPFPSWTCDLSIIFPSCLSWTSSPSSPCRRHHLPCLLPFP